MVREFARNIIRIEARSGGKKVALKSQQTSWKAAAVKKR
jgi:predicted metalloprotease with PDZ domain